MKRSNLRVVWSLALILVLALTACGGGAGTTGNATQQVPETGNVTEAAPGGDTLATATTEGGAVPAETATTEGGAVTEATATTEGGGADAEATATTEGGDAAGQPTATQAAGGDTGGTWQGEQIGGTVSVLAIWGGVEQDNFMAMIQPFIEQTGIEVQYEGTRDLGAVLNTRVQGGNPPDVAALPNPGQLVKLAQDGSLKPLNDVLDMNAMQEQYDPGFLQLASVNDQLYGIFTKSAVKSLVWYNPKAFDAKGYEVPTTWEELDALEEQIASEGVTPWCVGIDGGAGSGWPGTDWVEDIMLRTAGPETYDQWVRHEIPWTDPAVKTAFETWGGIVADETMAYGGSQYVIATNFGQAFNPMFEETPGCYLHRQANFVTEFFTEQFPDLVAGEDYNFFILPPIDEAQGNTLLVAGDLFGMFNDTPQARALMQYLVTVDAQRIWAERGGFISANRTMDPSVYPDEISQQIGAMIAEAESVRFDGSDQMPEGVNAAFSQAVLQYVQSPDQLDSILQQVETTAEGQYQSTQ